MSGSSAGRSRNANGDSSIYQDKDGNWHGRVSMGTKVDGSPDRRHVRGKNKTAVSQKVRELVRERATGEYAAAGTNPTVEQWLIHWVENVAPRNVRRKTLASYETDVYRHLIPGIGGNRLKRLSTVLIEKFYATLLDKRKVSGDGHTVAKYRPATVHHIHRTLSASLANAVRSNLLATNPAKNAAPPPGRTADDADYAIDPFTVSEARSIIGEVSNRRNGQRFVIALSAGLRQGEALGLRWRNVDLDSSPTKVEVKEQLQRHTWRHGCGTKDPILGWPCSRKRGCDCPGGHDGGLKLTPVKSRAGGRWISLDPVTAEALRAHRRAQADERLRAGEMWEDHGFVCTQPNGRPVDPRADLREWKDVLAAAGVRESRLHDARHTAATFLLVQGVDARVVMELMGWSSIAMLKRYQHVIDQLRNEAAEKVGTYLYGDQTGTA